MWNLKEQVDAALERIQQLTVDEFREELMQHGIEVEIKEQLWTSNQDQNTPLGH